MDSVKVRKKDGETVIQLLRSLNLLNTTYKIKQAGDFLILPLINSSEISAVLEDKELQYTFIDTDFELSDTRNRSLKEILSQVIPQDLLQYVPRSYDIVGSVIIIDLDDNILDHKFDIGLALQTIHPDIQTVYLKSEGVKGKFRLRTLELISGVDEPLTVDREFSLNIVVNVQTCYFSPRLSTEHRRVAEECTTSESILDMFSGVGPFSLHLASMYKNNVTAIDHNPKAIKCLKISITRNKLRGQIDAICMNAEEILTLNRLFDTIIMNHPSDSNRYLKVADSVLKLGGVIYYYTFVPVEDYELKAKEEFLSSLSNYSILYVHRVRQYSPSELHVVVKARKR